MALFEPRQTSAARCDQSKSVTANCPRAGSKSPNWANDSSVLTASDLSSLDLVLYSSSSMVDVSY